MMMPITNNAAPSKTPSFILPIPVPSSAIPIDLSDIISPSIINNKLFPPQQVSCHKEQSSQDQPKYEVADIFNLYGEEFRRNNKLTTEQLKVMYAIEHCRTSEYGFHADICDTCGHIESAYNSCRNRHCPKCQGIAKRKWVEARIDELLPVAHHHATFTIPTIRIYLDTTSALFCSNIWSQLSLSRYKFTNNRYQFIRNFHESLISIFVSCFIFC